MTLPLDFARTLVDEWVRGGVALAAIAPGSRSSPLALALLGEDRIASHVRLDERSAAFFALGSALASGRPAVLVTTSGTAATEVHAAVVEADLARVPLIVVTADRPPELHGVGAPQTVEQHGLFGRAVRYFVEPGVPDENGRPYWRSLGARLVAEARSSPLGPGPVHANLAFREPLAGEPGELPPGRARGAPWHDVLRPAAAGPLAAAEFLDAIGRPRGVFIAGGGAIGRGAESALLELAGRIGWPVLADARGARRVSDRSLVAHSDGVLRSATALRRLRPEVVVHLGSPHASRVLASWCADLADSGIPAVLVDPFGSFEDPERRVSTVLGADPGELVRLALEHAGIEQPLLARRDEAWLTAWRSADDAAAAAIDAVLRRAAGPTEPGVARAVFEALPAGGSLVASSSMPIRDLDWFAAPRPDAPEVLSNRGANGIDGVVSTVLGVAASASGPVVGLLGDLALLHDLSGLVWGVREAVPRATLVVIDNAGGGIFSFLSYPDLIADELFERGFGTPQRAGIVALTTALGWEASALDDLDEIRRAVADAGRRDGISVIVVSTERRANVAVHTELNAAVAAAVDSALGS